MADKIATRESYGNALKELALDYPDLVVLDADLAAATKTGIFQKQNRVFDVIRAFLAFLVIVPFIKCCFSIIKY